MGLELKVEEKSILTLFTGDKNQYIIPPSIKDHTLGMKSSVGNFLKIY